MRKTIAEVGKALLGLLALSISLPAFFITIMLLYLLDLGLRGKAMLEERISWRK